jgi:hypothetical protein
LINFFVKNRYIFRWFGSKNKYMEGALVLWLCFVVIFLEGV